MTTAYSDGSLIFNTEIDPKGFNKGLKNLSKSTRSLPGTLASIGKTFAGTLIGAGIVKGLTNLANQAIELSSDMKEVQNVVDTAFESMAYKAEEFADISIEQFGMSKLAAKQTASTYMAMGKSMGLSMEAASDMAVEVAKMTGDVASFYNLSQDMAATKLKSIWTGETETLKDLGVVMTEANLQQYALNMGITKSYSAMSQAEKVSLRYSYVMNALTDAQGDFAKTSNSWANQTRVLSERWKELLSILGGGLIRVLTPALTVINTILQALINLANAFANTIGKLFGWNKEVKVSGTAAIDAADGQEELADATAEAGKAASDSLASFDQLNVLQQDTGSGEGAGGGGGGVELVDTEGVETDTSKFDEISDVIKKLQPYVDQLRDAWEKLRIAFEAFINSPGVQACVQLFKDMAEAIALVAAQSVLGTLTGGLKTLSAELDFWRGILDAAVKLMNGDFKGAMESAGGSIKSLGDVITGQKNILDALPEWMMNAANGVVGYYRTFLNAMSLLVSIDWAGIWENAKNNAIEKLTTLRDNLNLLWISIRDTAKTKWNELKTNIVTTWDSIQTSMQTKWEAFKNGMSGLLTSMKTNSQNILNQITTFLKGTFSKNWETAWDGVALKLKSVWNGIVATIESAVNLIIDAINWCINQINKIHIDVPDWVTDLTGMDGFGFNIPNLNKVSIPRLATGAVIPPNGEFLAMLGDQKSGNNIEAPESLLRQIVREESGSGDIIINARGTMGQLIRLLKLEIEREDNRRGPTFTPGGAY